MSRSEAHRVLLSKPGTKHQIGPEQYLSLKPPERYCFYYYARDWLITNCTHLNKPMTAVVPKYFTPLFLMDTITQTMYLIGSINCIRSILTNQQVV